MTETKNQWIEVDNNCFEFKEGGEYKTTLLINRCTQLKRSVRRVRDTITLSGGTRDECDHKIAIFCEKEGVKLLFKMPIERTGAIREGGEGGRKE